MINEICQLLFPRPMTDAQKNYFKAVLLSGLPDFEWTVEYDAYLLDQNNDEKRRAVEEKLKSMFYTMFSIPEFQLS